MPLDNWVKILWIVIIGMCSLICACNQSDLTPVEQNGKWGYVNSKKEIVIPPKFDDALPFSEKLAAIKMRDKWGYIDGKGRVIIVPNFDVRHVKDFS